MSFTSRIETDGAVTQVDRPAAPDLVVTEEDVKDAGKLARLVMSIAKDVAALKRRFAPRRMDFEDVTVDSTGTTKYRFEHRFGGRVRWWCVMYRDPSGASGGTATLRQHADTDKDTLVLVSLVEGVVDVRIEEAG